MILTLSLAIVVAVAIKVVGVLLIVSLLIIPAAAARPLSRTPESMAFIAAAVGCIAIVAGLRTAWFLDTQADPSIVGIAAILFAMSSIVGVCRQPGGHQ